jgi:uncharacterized protein (TIGR00288 family)
MTSGENSSVMAVFLDVDNIVIGAREADYPKFDIQKVLERLLLKGLIVVKKAYCDFGRYGDLKRSLHEAAFEMIEIPHVSQSGKNSADIRMVVDALDLCYTKNHVDTFVIISGDSDFSPLVSKLRENAKRVIGMGVKNSSSKLFINNCDEFLYYDDLVRKEQAKPVKQAKPTAKSPTSETTEDATSAGKPTKLQPTEAVEKVRLMLEALLEERDETSLVHISMIKEALKRREPGFNEKAFGFKTFSSLMLEAEKRGVVKVERQEKGSGVFVRLPDLAV